MPEPNANSGLTVHGAMALKLMGKCARQGCASDAAADPAFAVWAELMPRRRDVEVSMPLTWTKAVTENLPEGAKSALKTCFSTLNLVRAPFAKINSALLQKQRDKFEQDWLGIFKSSAHGLRNVDENERREQYRYYWLLVNTRCFYWDFPHRANEEQQPKVKRPRVSRPKKQRPRDDCMAMAPFIDMFNHDIEAVSCVHDGVSVNANGPHLLAESGVV